VDAAAHCSLAAWPDNWMQQVDALEQWSSGASGCSKWQQVDAAAASGHWSSGAWPGKWMDWMQRQQVGNGLWAVARRSAAHSPVGRLEEGAGGVPGRRAVALLEAQLGGRSGDLQASSAG
jgi:hypothetical protein